MTAFETSLGERSLPVLDILTAVTRSMTEGELIQLMLIGRPDIDEAQYFDVLQRKTAHLFSACCEIGALLSNAPRREQEALREYGLSLGTAFQLVDDLLDFTSLDETLGKAAGVDLTEGKLTLPVIYLLEEDDRWRAPVQAVMREGNYAEVSRAALLDAAHRTGAIERARARATEYAARAQRALDALPDTKYKEALRSIPTYILERDS